MTTLPTNIESKVSPQVDPAGKERFDEWIECSAEMMLKGFSKRGLIAKTSQFKNDKLARMLVDVYFNEFHIGSIVLESFGKRTKCVRSRFGQSYYISNFGSRKPNVRRYFSILLKRMMLYLEHIVSNYASSIHDS